MPLEITPDYLKYLRMYADEVGRDSVAEYNYQSVYCKEIDKLVDDGTLVKAEHTPLYKVSHETIKTLSAVNPPPWLIELLINRRFVSMKSKDPYHAVIKDGDLLKNLKGALGGNGYKIKSQDRKPKKNKRKSQMKARRKNRGKR